MYISCQFICHYNLTCHKDLHFSNSLMHWVFKVGCWGFLNAVGYSWDTILIYQIHLGNIALWRKWQRKQETRVIHPKVDFYICSMKSGDWHCCFSLYTYWWSLVIIVYSQNWQKWRRLMQRKLKIRTSFCKGQSNPHQLLGKTKTSKHLHILL